MTVTIIPVETPSLGDRSYLVHDGRVAFVVDPQRDIDRLLAVAERAGVTITHVLETHIHNDYVTGGYALARRTGAQYLVNADDEVSFERTPVADGDVVEVSPNLHLRVLATPGHTFTHLSYVLQGESPALFSGGSLLFGATGRPDLLGATSTHELARHQYRTARRLADHLPDDARLLPTHGFGGFCATTATGAEISASTIGREREVNPVLSQDEEEYVADVLAGLDAYPDNYAHMGPLNAAGPGEPDLSPPARADAAELRRRLEAGEWLLDLRHRTAFAAGHVPGTYNVALDVRFASYLGWLLPWGAPVTLLGETEAQVAEAQREMVRIGIDRPAAATSGRPEWWTEGPLVTTPRASFADLEQVRHHRAVVVLDVRREKEWEQAHVDGAVHVPLHALLDRRDDIPAGEVWVHCASGYRASVAASILAAHGRQTVLIDDSFQRSARACGLPLAGRDVAA